jgi:acetyl esterase/lipase
MHTSSFLLPLAASVVLASPAPQKQNQNGGQGFRAQAVSTASISTSTAGSATSTSSGSMPTVTLDYSTIVAAAANTTVGYYKYQNIRFAQAPVGDLRFAKPLWPLQETDVNDGTLADSDVDCSAAEDCLFMDIWAPANSAGKSLPVLQWTYGGGFTGGSKSQNTPEGLFDLSTEFIFVSYNYRLGMTGLANGPLLLHQGGVSNPSVWDVQQAFVSNTRDWCMIDP